MSSVAQDAATSYIIRERSEQFLYAFARSLFSIRQYNEVYNM